MPDSSHPDYRVEPYKVGVTETYEGVGSYQRTETRYRITVDGKVVDDAQGYGYKSAAAAHRSWSYQHGGKQRMIEKRTTARRWLRLHPGVCPLFEQITENNLKEIALGEVNQNEVFETLEERFGPIPAEVRWALWEDLL
jgi:hypothetical protein